MRKAILFLLLAASVCAQQSRREERREEQREERRERRRRQSPPAAQPRAGVPWAGILDPSRAVDWSTAGIPGGIPNVTTQCGSTLTPSGGDDTATLQAALNSCSTTSGSFVQLAAGTFHTYGTVYIPTYVVLRGMGADKTIIRMDAVYIPPQSSLYGFIFGQPFSNQAAQPTYARVMGISSNNLKGDTTLTVASIGQATISQLAVGDLVWIAAINDWFPACAGYPATVPSTSHCINIASDIENATPGGASAANMDGAFSSNPWGQRAAGQMDLITAISTATNTITLQDPLVDSFRHPLQDWVANSPANPILGFNQGMGIHPSGSTHVYVESAYTHSPAPGYCLTGPTAPAWPTDGSTVTESVPGIASPNVPCAWQDHGPGTDSIPRLMYWVPAVNVGIENLQIYGVNNLQWGPFRSLIVFNNCKYCWTRGIEINRPVGMITMTAYSYHGQIEQNFYTSSWYHGSGTDSIIEIGSGTSGFLVQNNIFERTPGALFTDNGSSGNVIAYNYVLGSWGGNALNAAGGNFISHDAYPWFNLQEGNISTGAGEDGIHGGNALGTKFRNWNRGTTKICQPVTATGLTGGNPTRPPVPTVTTNAVGGTTTYSYAVELVVAGAQSAPSVNATITNGPASLSTTTYNTITAPNVPNANVIVSQTPPPNAPTDKCLIFRTAGGTAAQIGSVPCDGTTPLQDTGQASTGIGIGGTGPGSSILPGTATTCVPLGPNEYTNGVNAWFAYNGAWIFSYNQLSMSFNDVGNVFGSQDRMTMSQSINYAERHRACSICNSHCVSNGANCGNGGTTCPSVTCGANSRNYSWLLDESFGYGSGASGNGMGTWDTTLAQDTAYHCRNYYHSIGGVEAGDCASSTALPPSFYLTAKPAWWGAAPWPPIGPDVTGGLAQSYGYAYNNPAKNCYENVMGGTDGTGAPFLTFNAAACYSVQAPAGPAIVQGSGTLQGQGTVK